MHRFVVSSYIDDTLDSFLLPVAGIGRLVPVTGQCVIAIITWTDTIVFFQTWRLNVLLREKVACKLHTRGVQ